MAALSNIAYDSRFRNMTKVTITWTSAANGTVATSPLEQIDGDLIKAVTIPAAGGSAPTDNYDIDITDAAGVNILTNCKVGLHDRDTANTEEQYFFVLNNDSTALSMAKSPVVCDILTVTVTNAGDTKSGTIILYFRPSRA